MAAVETRSQRVSGDRQSSPRPSVWGALSALGYGLTEPWPQRGAFVPFVVSASYAIVGLWQGLRFIVAGAVIAGLTLGGFFLLPPVDFALWMAGVGGGALSLAGCWFRRV